MSQFALYILPSYLNHSSVPNCVVHFTSSKSFELRLASSLDVNLNDRKGSLEGVALTINYLNPTLKFSSDADVNNLAQVLSNSLQPIWSQDAILKNDASFGKHVSMDPYCRLQRELMKFQDLKDNCEEWLSDLESVRESESSDSEKRLKQLRKLRQKVEKKCKKIVEMLVSSTDSSSLSVLFDTLNLNKALLLKYIYSAILGVFVEEAECSRLCGKNDEDADYLFRKAAAIVGAVAYFTNIREKLFVNRTLMLDECIDMIHRNSTFICSEN